MVYRQRALTSFWRKRKASSSASRYATPAKRRRLIARLRRTNRKFYKRRANRRIRRRVPYWRRDNRYDTEVFRTGPAEIFTIGTLETKNFVFSPTMDPIKDDNTVKTMFFNKALHYEQFKCKKVYMKFWVENTGMENLTDYKKPDFVYSYDPDDKAINNFHLISARPNSKFKRLDTEKTHTFKITPVFPTNVSATGTNIDGYRSRKHDNPWFDSADFNSDGEIGKFEPDNSIKMSMFNPNSFTLKLRGYYVYVIKYRYHKRQTT